MQSRFFPLLLLLGFAVLTIDVAGQAAGDPGVIQLDGNLVQIGINHDGVEITFVDEPDASGKVTDIDLKIAQMTRQIENYLAITEEQEDRQLSDQESLYRATSYARKLVGKIELLRERIVFLDEQQELSKKIKAAADAFDVAVIKQLLKEKLALEDETVAEAAFQLGGFQELDGEYQDAWANYQKASNLQPENQLYMDAHGKNEF